MIAGDVINELSSTFLGDKAVFYICGDFNHEYASSYGINHFKAGHLEVQELIWFSMEGDETLLNHTVDTGMKYSKAGIILGMRSAMEGRVGRAQTLKYPSEAYDL